MSGAIRYYAEVAWVDGDTAETFVPRLVATLAAAGYRILGPDDVEVLAEQIAESMPAWHPIFARQAARVACGVTDG